MKWIFHEREAQVIYSLTTDRQPVSICLHSQEGSQIVPGYLNTGKTKQDAERGTTGK